ncbi:M20/M25/M40 family metallo-hydrolase [Sinomonas sp. R1AF57]|uniref:M20/M25/M40 family metallo-hydrolase n=1 Tax=Sinomonas sp. R1AF57 TaxID=2020377 RepID=UPI0021014219|nr:M20/M25/M40 family metallo-hydrolase [Sinomonas sp. R1AF57]
MMPFTAALRAETEAGFDDAIADLRRLVAIPGSAWAALDPAPLERSAQLVAELFEGTGFPEVRIVREARPDGAPGAPSVLASRPAAPGRPTVLLYAHHDVQPAGDPRAWHTPPFEATRRDGRLFGRGVADNKGGVVLHLAAYRAFARAVGAANGLGVVVFIDGEEEIGSPSLPQLLSSRGDLLRADVVVVADSGNWRVGVPALTTSLRGIATAVIEVRVLDHALHSGTFGGPVLDALAVTSQLIASLYGPDGSVAVAGLGGWDSSQVDLSEDDYRADAGVLPGVRLAGSGSIASRLWTKPALSVVGLDAPGVDVSSDAIVPAARAKISLRLAPGDEPLRALEAVRAHLESHTPLGAHVSLVPGSATKSFAGDGESPAARTMRRAMEEAWGVAPVLMGVGGSIPAAAELAAWFPHAQVLINGAEDPDSRAHGADESIDLADYRRAIFAEALLLASLEQGA